MRGKPETRLRSLLTGGLTAAILSLPSLRLEVKRAPRKYRKERGESTAAVTVQTTGVIKDPPRLAGMFVVVRETLNALAGAGVAGR